MLRGSRHTECYHKKSRPSLQMLVGQLPAGGQQRYRMQGKSAREVGDASASGFLYEMSPAISEAFLNQIVPTCGVRVQMFGLGGPRRKRA